jgi:hypothetical protein
MKPMLALLPLLFLYLIKPVALHAQKANSTDSLALVALFDSTNGTHWTNKTNWLDGPVKSWFGIKLNSDGRVAGVKLTDNSLKGNIPSQLGNLSALDTLKLENNYLGGTLPSSLGNLNPHALDISNNRFTFNGMELLAIKFTFAVYAPQDTILPLHFYQGKLSVSAGGVLNYDVFTWFKNGVQVAQITGDSTFATSGAGKYTVVVTNTKASKLRLYSNTFTVLPAPVITSFSPTVAVSGMIVTIAGKYFTGATVVSFGGTAATSFTVVSDSVIKAITGKGSTGAVLVKTPWGTATLSGFTYCDSTTVSRVTISDGLTTTTLCAGTKVTFVASGANSANTLTYQWWKDGVKVGADSYKYVDSTLKTGDSVFVTLTNTASCAMTHSAKSNVLKFYVNPIIKPSVTISDSLATTAICAYSKVVFTANAQNGSYNFSYQWWKDGIKVGTNSPRFVDSTWKAADSVFVVIKGDAACAMPDSAKSNVLKLSVKPYVKPSVTISDSLNTTEICAYSKVIFTANAQPGGYNFSYQWWKDGIKVGTNNSNYIDSTLKTGDSVYVVIKTTEHCVFPDSAKSNVLIFYAKPPVRPSVTISDGLTTTEVCAGTKITFIASGQNGNHPFNYQWWKDGVKVGTNSSKYIDSTLKTGDFVYVVLTGDAPCTMPDTVKSNLLEFAIQSGLPAKPSAISGPDAAKPGEKGLVFKVKYVQGVHYIWSVPAGDSITSAQGRDSITVDWYGGAGTVYVRASNACGESDTVALHVAAAPGANGHNTGDNTGLELGNINLLVFPNPAAGNTNLQISGFKGGIVVTITDLTGKPVWQKEKLTNGTYTLPISTLAAGIYIVTVKCGQNIKSTKLVKAD